MAASPAGALRACRLRENVREQGDCMSQISWQDFEKVEARSGNRGRAVPGDPQDFDKASRRFRTGGRGKEDQRPAHGALLAGDASRAAGGGGGEFTSEAHRGLKSEVLVLGVPDEEGAVVLLVPDHEVPPDGRIC